MASQDTGVSIINGATLNNRYPSGGDRGVIAGRRSRISVPIRSDFRLPTNICHAHRSEGDIGEARHSAPHDGIAGWRITRAGEIASEACDFDEIMG